MKVNLISVITEIAIFFAMYNSIWHRRAWAYVPRWDENLCFIGKQESITGEW